MKILSLGQWAYWSIAVFAIVNAVIFIMSLMVESEAPTNLLSYLHYNLVLAVGYILVYIMGRYSLSPLGIAIALFLFIVSLLVSAEIPANIPPVYLAGWAFVKWVLFAPIVTTFILLFVRPEPKNPGQQKPNFRL